MADFKTPNLCGANETLNGALSKIKNLKDEIIAQSTALPSVKKAAFESKLADVKAGLDALAIDLPEAKPVNFQSEITSLINDIDKTTAEGLAAFNLKVAELKKDFGGAISDKGLDFDNLISESTTKLGKDISTASTALSSVVTDATGAVTDIFNSVTDSVSGVASNISSGLGISGVPGNVTPSLDAFGGAGDAVAGVATPTIPTVGNICALVPNFELPASAAGTGVTTQEIEERVSNAATITLTQTPKEILEVTGKKTTQSFFTNIQYTQNGKIIVPKATGTYSTIKVTFTIDLIQEKPVAAKQADAPPEAEEFSSITVNASIEEAKTALKAKVESVKTGEVFVKADPIKDVESVVTKVGKTIKVTTPTKSTTTTTETITTTTGGGSTTTFASPVTKRKTQSDNGLSTRLKISREYFVLKGSINEEYWSGGGKKFNTTVKQKKHKVVDDISNIRLKYDYTDIKFMRVKVEGKAVDLTATKIKDYYGRRKEDGYKRLDYSNARRGKSADKFNELDFVGGSILAADSKLVEIIDYDTGQPLSEGSTAYIAYYYYEKVDPNFSG